jgi:methyl acetate hydrolase
MWSPNAPIAAFIQPLAFDPGTRFRYGIGIDWAGIMVTRLSGLDLEAYFQKYIWTPCGAESMSFLPPRDWDQAGMAMTVREPFHTGSVKLLEGTAMGRPMNPDEIGPVYMGGGGLFGTARDYLAFLRGLLRSADPATPDSERLVQPDTFKLLFQDSIAEEHAPQIRKDIATMAGNQHIHDPAILTGGTGEQVGYGPALLLNKVDSKFGRKAMSGFWDGAAKTYYWLDPTTGVAVSCTRLVCKLPS